MGLVRTTITLPEDILREVDEVAGGRGRSRYIADVVARQVRRDHGRRVFADLAGALRGSETWGKTPEATDRILAGIRSTGTRDATLYGARPEDDGAIPAGHDPADRSRARPPRRARGRGGAVQRTE